MDQDYNSARNIGLRLEETAPSTSIIVIVITNSNVSNNQYIPIG